MDDLVTRYRVKPSFSLVAHSADVVELRRGVWNPISITLTDRSSSGKLFRALKMMTGEPTLKEIADEVELTDNEAKDLVTFLTRHDAVETEPGNVLDFQLETFRNTLGTGSPDFRFDRVVFLGADDFTAEVSALLEEFEDLTSLKTACSALQDELQNSDYTLSYDPLEFRKKLERFENWQGCLLVVASLTIHPIFLRNVNRVCLHYGIPWLHAVADGPFLIVGPTFIPQKSSCYECFETRVALTMRENESYLNYKRALANQAVHLGKPFLAKPFRGVLASLAASEIANLAATGSNFTVGKALAVYLPTLEFSFNEVLRAPGCAGCSPMTEQHEQGLYFDLKGYVNSLYSGNSGQGKS